MGGEFHGGDEMKLKSIPILLLLPALMLVLSMWTAVLAGACSNAPTPLSESDETARQSFLTALEGSNQWKRWSNDLPTSAALGPDTQTWNEKLQELSYSISRAESVSL